MLLVALAGWRRMDALDARLVPPVGLDLLRGIRVAALLAPAVLEALARGLREVRVPAGTSVVVEGEAGDAFYVIESGRVRVTQEGRPLREQGPGEHFGEIALLPTSRGRRRSSRLDRRGAARAGPRGVPRRLTGEPLALAGEVVATRLRHRG